MCLNFETEKNGRFQRPDNDIEKKSVIIFHIRNNVRRYNEANNSELKRGVEDEMIKHGQHDSWHVRHGDLPAGSRI
jgi:hypothetical protein